MRLIIPTGWRVQDIALQAGQGFLRGAPGTKCQILTANTYFRPVLSSLDFPRQFGAESTTWKIDPAKGEGQKWIQSTFSRYFLRCGFFWGSPGWPFSI
jgi:hypothetical protein